jgi:ribosomal protein L7Ae-like RNA K-turn-binding protein
MITPAEFEKWLLKSCEDQGVPYQVDDPEAILGIIVILKSANYGN